MATDLRSGSDLQPYWAKPGLDNAPRVISVSLMGSKSPKGLIHLFFFYHGYFFLQREDPALQVVSAQSRFCPPLTSFGTGTGPWRRARHPQRAQAVSLWDSCASPREAFLALHVWERTVPGPNSPGRWAHWKAANGSPFLASPRRIAKFNGHLLRAFVRKRSPFFWLFISV